MVEDPLGLERRRQLYELLTSTPGLHLREIARQLEVDVRTADYHLHHLSKHGLASGIQEGGYLRYYPRTANGRRAEVVDARDKPLLAVLRKPVPLFVALTLLAHDAATHSELAGAADVSPSTLSYHLDRMERANVLGRDGARYLLREPERIAQILYAHRPTPDLIDRFVDLWEDFAL